MENRTHHTLDVTDREDQSRVRHANATTVLSLFRRLSNALKHDWAIGRPRRESPAADWIERSVSNRRLAIDLLPPWPRKFFPVKWVSIKLRGGVGIPC